MKSKIFTEENILMIYKTIIRYVMLDVTEKLAMAVKGKEDLRVMKRKITKTILESVKKQTMILESPNKTGNEG